MSGATRRDALRLGAAGVPIVVGSRDTTRAGETVGRLREAVPLIRHHHERWDGRGYPDGLAGEDIPLEAGIVGLADAWDAMTTDRPYQAALRWDDAAEELRRGRGTQFSPDVVDAFFRVLRRRSLPGAGAELDRAAG
jgi:HD-GYP domain-containing protein (c-di-GMP phosphodiesterase class II)